MNTPTVSEIAAMPDRQIDGMCATLDGWQYVREYNGEGFEGPWLNALGTPPRGTQEMAVPAYTQISELLGSLEARLRLQCRQRLYLTALIELSPIQVFSPEEGGDTAIMCVIKPEVRERAIACIVALSGVGQ